MTEETKESKAKSPESAADTKDTNELSNDDLERAFFENKEATSSRADLPADESTEGD